VADRVAAAAKSRNGNVTICITDTPEYNGNSPPATVAAAMREADVIFTLLDKGIGHSPEAKDALDNGSRMLALTGFRPHHLTSDSLRVDFEELRPHCERLARKFTHADEAHLSSKKGTAISLGLEGRDGNSHHGIVDEPGMWLPEPNVEVKREPVEGRVEGMKRERKAREGHGQ
jgi:leucyl aminopeptidase (aminopeptidase T)